MKISYMGNKFNLELLNVSGFIIKDEYLNSEILSFKKNKCDPLYEQYWYVDIYSINL